MLGHNKDPAFGVPPNIQLKKALAGVPVPLGGLALGIVSLGAAWGIFIPDMAAYRKAHNFLIFTL